MLTQPMPYFQIFGGLWTLKDLTRFDEATLYDMRSFAYRPFTKAVTGKWAKDQWAEDTRP